ncbi:MAG: SBBP repeat-containing protein [Saprospiraceae bacterium]|nr:SBBP repeat-containing protein [Saprospiraceae bacterium]
MSLLSLLLVVLAIFALISCSTGSSPLTGERDNGPDIMNDLSLPFIINNGIYPDSVDFYADIDSGKMFITGSSELCYSWRDSQNVFSFYESFDTANIGNFQIKQESPTKVSYFRGSDPEKWFTGNSTAKSLEYENIYYNIDLELKAYKSNIEKVFTVKPGGDPNNIIISVKQQGELDITENRELRIKYPESEFRFTNPVAYQVINGKRFDVKANYRIIKDDQYCFELGSYDQSYDLIIDPLIASTYVGGSSTEYRGSMCLAPNNDIYVFGQSTSEDLPFPEGTFQDSMINGLEPLIIKMSSDLSQILAASYISGTGGEASIDICVGNFGNVYIFGFTDSEDFPVTQNAYCTTYYPPMYDLYVSCLSPDLTTLCYSTYLGGCNSEYSRDIERDINGNIYITGHTRSFDFPTTPGAYDETFNTVINAGDAFISKFDPTLSTLLSSTYLGSGAYDEGNQLEFDDDGNLYILGYSTGSNFPTTPGAYCNDYNGMEDIFISKIDPELTTLYCSTLFGGSFTEAHIDPSFKLTDEGYIYVAGVTRSNDLPITPGVFDPDFEAISEAFIFRISDDLTELLACTYSGDWGMDYFYGVNLSNDGNVYVCGSTTENSNYATPNAFMTELDPERNWQGIIIKLDPDFTQILTGTYFGGTESDFVYSTTLIDNNIILFGKTYSTDLPTTPGAYSTYLGETDWFLSVLDSDLSAGNAIENNEIVETDHVKCYPNPFPLSSGRLTISFDISDNYVKSVEIYNIKGQKVKTFRQNNVSGNNTIYWDGKNEQGRFVATGTYLCRVTTKQVIYDKKLIIMK